MAHSLADRTAARLFGVFFILTFLSYGVGASLIETVVGAPDLLASVAANKTLIMTGALLMAVVHTVLNVAMPAVLLPILKRYSPTLAYGYLALAVTATVVLVLGAVFLLLLMPLADAYVSSSSPEGHLGTQAVILRQGGFFSYQLGMAIWGVGGLALCAVLYRAGLVPRLLSLWGVFGYVVFIAGTVLEILGYSGVGLLCSAPGGLFEVSLSLWLMVKGFEAQPSTGRFTAQAATA